jgi:transcriptional regulator with XRE-family HTH domain
LVKDNHRRIAGVSTLLGLASRLRRLRQRHQLTQEQFAETIGLNYKFYQQIEAGRKKQIWLETVERLAAGFGLEAWQLIAPEEPAHTVISPLAKEDRAGRHLAVAEPAATYQVKRKTRKKHPNSD